MISIEKLNPQLTAKEYLLGNRFVTFEFQHQFGLKRLKHSRFHRDITYGLEKGEQKFPYYKAGPSFLAFLYERLQVQDQDCSLRSILGLAQELVAAEDSFAIPQERDVQNILGFFMAFEAHIYSHPEYYTPEFLDHCWSDQDFAPRFLE